MDQEKIYNFKVLHEKIFMKNYKDNDNKNVKFMSIKRFVQKNLNLKCSSTIPTIWKNL